MNKSSMHLVPLLKGAVDPNKGIILRTYYVRPEKLKSMTEVAKASPTKSYIGRIINYDAVDKAIKTGDITGLRSAFPKKSKSWDKIVKRHKVFDTYASTSQFQQKLNQNIYGYILSEDKIALSTIKANYKKAAKVKKFNIDNKEKPINGGLNRKKRAQKQINVQESVTPLSFPIIPKNLLFTLNNAIKYKPTSKNDSSLSSKKYEHSPDFGSNVQFKVKMSNGYQPIQFGHNISKFINFTNAHPTKIANITKQFVTASSLSDVTGTIPNIGYKASVYFNDPKFWAPLLSKCCFDFYSNSSLKPADYDPALNFYRQLILLRLNKTIFSDIQKTYHDDKIDHVLQHRNNLSNLLLSKVLTVQDKAYLLASLDSTTNIKYMDDIMSYISDVAKNDVGASFELAAAVSTTLKQEKIIELFLYIFPDLFNIERMLHALHLSEINKAKPDFTYFLLQLLGAKINKTHYTPYNSIKNIDHGIFAPMLVSRLFGYFVKNRQQEIIKFIGERKIKNKQFEPTIKVGAKMLESEIPIDKQIFFSLPPFKNFKLLNNTDDLSDYILIGLAKRDSIMSVIDNNVLILDGFSSIDFRIENKNAVTGEQ